MRVSMLGAVCGVLVCVCVWSVAGADYPYSYTRSFDMTSYAGTCVSVSDFSGTAWTNAHDAQGSQTGSGNRAYVWGVDASESLRCMNYGFPSFTGTVVGFQLRAQMDNYRGCYLEYGYMVVGGVRSDVTAEGIDDWDIDGAEYVGSSSTIPGSLTLSPGDVTNSGFGYQLRFVDGDGGSKERCRVEYMRIQIWVEVVVTFTSFSPLSGPYGTSVTLTGINLDEVDMGEFRCAFTDGTTFAGSLASATEITCPMPIRSLAQSTSVGLGNKLTPGGVVLTSGQTYVYPAHPTPTVMTGISPASVNADLDGSGTTTSMTVLGAGVPTGSNVRVALVYYTLGCDAADPSLVYTLSSTSFTLDLDLPALFNGNFAVCLSTADGTPGTWVKQSAAIVRVVKGESSSITALWPKVIGATDTPTLYFSATSELASSSTRFGIGNPGCAHASVDNIVTYATPGASIAFTASPSPTTSRPSAVLCLSTDGNVWVEQSAVGTITVVPATVASVSPNVWGGGSVPSLTYTGAGVTATDRGTWLGFVASTDSCAIDPVLAPAPLGSTLPTPILPSAGADLGVTVCISQDGGSTWTATTATATITSPRDGVFTAFTPRFIVSGAPHTLTLTGITPTPTTYVRLSGSTSSCAAGSTYGDYAVAGTNTISSVVVTLGSEELRTLYLCVSTSGPTGPWYNQGSTPSNGLLRVTSSTSMAHIGSVAPSIIPAGVAETITYPDPTWIAQYPNARLGVAVSGGCTIPALRLWDAPFSAGSASVTVTPPAGTPPTAELVLCLTFDSTLVPYVMQKASLAVVVSSSFAVTDIVPSSALLSSPVSLLMLGAQGSSATWVALAEPGNCGSGPRYLETQLPLALTEQSVALAGGAPLNSPVEVETLALCFSAGGTGAYVEQSFVALSVTTDVAAAVVTTVSPPAIGAGSTIAVNRTGNPSGTGRIAFALPGACQTARVGGVNAFAGSPTVAPLGTPITVGGLYATCYSNNDAGGYPDASWIEQVSTTASLVVVEATANSIASIGISVFGTNSAPTLTLVRGAAAGLRCASCSLAFAAGLCSGSVVGVTPLPLSAGLVLPLGVPIAAAGEYSVCFSSGSGYVKQTGIANVVVVAAEATSVAAVAPATIGVGSTPTLGLSGAVGSVTTYIAFSLDPTCTTGRTSGGDVVVGGEAAWVLPSTFATAGNYTVCYSVSGMSGPFVAQELSYLNVIEALGGSIVGVSPSVIGSGAPNVFDVTNAEPSVMTAVVFVPMGTPCSTISEHVGLLEISSSAFSVPVLNPITSAAPANAVYEMCYTVTYGDVAESWVKQGPGASLTVIVPVSTAVSTVSPPIIAVNTMYSLTFASLVGSPNIRISFGLGGCGGVRVASTAVPVTGAPTALSSTIGTPGEYRLCLSTAAGAAPHVAQSSSVTLEVVEATPTSVTSLSPAVVGTGSTPAFTVGGGYKKTPATILAFSTDPACPPGSVVGSIDLSGSSGPTYSWTVPIAVASATQFSVCFSVDGGVTYERQTEVVLDVAVATAMSVVSLEPAVFGTGSGGADVVVAVSGPLASATAYIGFAASGGCATPIFSAPYTTTGEIDLSASSGFPTPGPYVVCYSVEGSSSGFVEQTGVAVSAMATDVSVIAAAAPAAYWVTGVGTMSMGVQLAVDESTFPLATTVIGIDPAGTCGSAVSVEGVTGLSTLSEATGAAVPAGWLIGDLATVATSTSATASLCLSFNSGDAFVSMLSPLEMGPAAPASALAPIAPSLGLQVGTASPIVLKGIAPASGPNTRVAFVPAADACSDAGARVGEVGYSAFVTVFGAVQPTIGSAGVYKVCVSHDDGATYVEQTETVVVSDCSVETSCASCRATGVCGWCAATSTCVLNTVIPTACATATSICDTTVAGSCALQTCPAVAAVSPTSAVASGGSGLTVTTDLAVSVPDLECKFVLAGTVVAAYTPAVVQSPTAVACSTAPAALGILSAEVSLTQSVGSETRVEFASASGVMIDYYECGGVGAFPCETCYDEAVRPDCGFCLLAGACLSRKQCLAAVSYNETLPDTVAQLVSPWIVPVEASPVQCPTVVGVAPTSATTTADVELTITGTVFVDAAGALPAVGGTRAAPGSVNYVYSCVLGAEEEATNATWVSSSELRCPLPRAAVAGSSDFQLLLNGREVARAPSLFAYELPPAPIPPPPSTTTRNVLIGLGAVLLVALCAAVVVAALLLKRKRDMDKLLEPPPMSRAEMEATVFGTPIGVSNDGKAALPLMARFVNEVVFDHELMAVLADVTPATEVDRVAKAAIVVYEHAGKALDLLLYEVCREVTVALTLQTLFRTNSMATKMFKLYSKMKGLEYVRSTLGRPINKIMMEDDVDVDGLKSGKGEGAQFQLLKLSQGLFNAVRASVPAVPTEFRYLFRCVQGAIQERFPVRAEELAPLMADALRTGLEETSTLYASGAQTFAHLSTVSSAVTGDTNELAAVLEPVHADLVAYEDSVADLAERLQEMSELVEKLSGATDPSSPAARRLLADLAASANSVGVGGFFFLRFLVPAITAPESYALVHELPDMPQRKLLVLLGKVIQNLSNQKEFGTKEEYMKPMNAMITSNAEVISSLLDELAQVPINAPPFDDLEPTPVPSKHLDGALAFLYTHAKVMLPKMIAKLQETTIGAVTLPSDVVSQRAAAAQLLTDIMAEIADAVASGGRGNGVDHDALRAAPFATAVPGLAPLLSGWTTTLGGLE